MSIIHALLGRLLGVVAPGTGRRRATTRRTSPRHSYGPQSPTPAAPLPPHRSPYCHHAPLDGSATAMTRPYLGRAA